MSRLSGSEIKSKLTGLNGWVFKDNAITKIFTFSAYMEGIKFVNKLANKAEAANHHPDLVIGWCRVEVAFTSHDQGGVTEKCLQKAIETDAIKL